MILSTDFWWLSPEEIKQYCYIDLFYQEPYSDEPNSDNDPSKPVKLIGSRPRLEDIQKRTVNFRNINVFRSYALYDSAIDGEEIVGPLVLDIDRSIEQESGYPPDLDKALKDTQLLIQEYCSNFKEDEYRIFFTGHKGFNIEIHPRVFGELSKVHRRRVFGQELREINNHYGRSFVDPQHEHVRLHRSINNWIDYSGVWNYAMKIQMTKRQLATGNVEDILNKAKKLALTDNQRS